MSSLAMFLVEISGTLAARVLLSLGFGFVSYAAIATVLNAAIGSARSAFESSASAAADSFAIVQLAGTGDAMGIISAGLVARAYLLTVKRLRPL